MSKSIGFVALVVLAAACLGVVGCASCPVCGMMKCAASEHEAYISTEALNTLINARTPVVLLDARTGKYDDGQRIPGAKSLSPDAKAEDVAALVKAKTDLVVTYCVNPKCPASHKLAENLESLGYKNVLEYHKGIEGWVKAGYPVEHVK